MARIRIDDLPILEELGQEELQGIYGEGLFPAERLRLLAAAATLGITLASAPFATAGNQGRGQGGGQGGRSGNSQGPSRTSSPLQIQRTSGNSHGGSHTVQNHTAQNHKVVQNQKVLTPRHTQSGHAWQSHTHHSGWQGQSHGGSQRYFEQVGSYCQQHGVKFSHGFYYAGKAHSHFTEKWYDWRYETYLYFDPHARCPYYWCEAHGVFYPIQYIETVPPGAKGPGPIVGGGPGAGAPGGAVPGAGAPGAGAPGGGAPGGGAPPTDAGQAPGGDAGGAGGAPGVGAQGGGGQGGGVQGGGAPGGNGSAAGSEVGAAADGAAGGPVGAAPGASNGGAGAAGAKAGAAPSGVSVAQRGTAAGKKQLQEVPPGTFDEAIPEDPN